MLANHKKGIFLLKRAFLGESRRLVRRLLNQILSLRLELHYFLYLGAINIYVTLYVTLYRELAFYLWNYQFGKQALQSYNFSLRAQQWKHSIWLIFERRL